MYEKCLFEIKRGRQIHILTACSDSDDAIERMLCEAGLDKYLVNWDEINVLLGGGGY